MSAAPGPDPGCRINRPLLSRQVHLPILPKRLISEDGEIRTRVFDSLKLNIYLNAASWRYFFVKFLVL